MKRVVIASIIVFILSFAIVPVVTASFSTFQGSNSNNGVVNFTGPSSAVLKCRTEPLNHELTSASPVVGNDGTIYIGTRSQNLYAINPDCSIKWIFEDPATTIASVRTPVIGDDATIYAANGATLFAVNPDGTKKWAYTPSFGYSFGFQGELKYHNGKIWAGGTKKVVAINAADGTLACSFDSELFQYPAFSTPTIVANYVYASDLSNVYKLDLNCNKIWTYDADRIYQSVPIVTNNKVYVSDFEGIFTLTTGGVRELKFEIDRARVLAIKDYFYNAAKKKLTLMHMDGRKKCEYDAGDTFSAAPLVDSNGLAYIGNENGKVYALDTNCAVRWEYTIGESIENAAAFGVNDELIVPSADRRLYIFKNREPTAELPRAPGEIERPPPYTRRICESCLFETIREGKEFVDRCEGGFQDVQGCYAAAYDCATQEVLNRTVCDLCVDGACGEGPVVNLPDEAQPRVPDLVEYTDDAGECQSCVLEGAVGGTRFVDNCEGGFRDREACYVVNHPCGNQEIEDIAEKELCNSCSEGVCSDYYQRAQPSIVQRIVDFLKGLFGLSS